ncbi:MAG: TerC family protein [Alphaproteobacteria bacterium]|nr:TerC family protein [Alphaproteobacteria bacterium]
MFDLETLFGLLTLTGLEIVLGIDNIVVIAIIAATLPVHQREQARVIGLSLAMITRLMLLFSIAWIAGLTQPMVMVGKLALSGRDLLMLGGGLFLIVKAVREMHEAMEAALAPEASRKPTGFASAIAQIVVLDVVFSFDSVITAVGMAREIWVMAAAVIIAVFIMLIASGPIMRFIHVNPTIKMLALAFVLLIGMALVAEGMGFAIPKGYLYFAMLFSVFVESLNVAMARRRRKAEAEVQGGALAPPSKSEPLAGNPVPAQQQGLS